MTRSRTDGAIRVDLPSQWGTPESQGLAAYGRIVPSLSAGDYNAVYASHVHIIGSPDPDVFAIGTFYSELRELFLPSLGYCDSNGRHRLRTDRYQIRYEVRVGCMAGNVVLARLRSRDGRGSAAVVMAVQGPRDLEVLARIVDSLELSF